MVPWDMKLAIRAVLGLICLGSWVGAQEPAAPYVDGQAAADRMVLVTGGSAVPVYTEAGDHEVVRVAAADLVADIERVTGCKPTLSNTRIDSEVRHRPLPRAIVIGSLDRSEVIRGMVEAGKLDVTRVQGQWEAFTLQVVANPVAGVNEALVIAGSDRRGTAYGVYELSRRIGVSPWYWWADITPEKRSELHVSRAPLVVGPPGVKYRGIFINDEMWALRPWAEGTFAPEEGRGLGPKTYAKIFELLLRLRANYIWPAMHQRTKAFHLYEGNKLVADRYAIVMGGSHTEVMLRNNIHGAEWDVEHGGDGGEWNYMTQPQKIQDYWIRGVKKWGMYENLYNVGMRGRDDEPMKGPPDVESRIRLMEKIFQDQRDIIAKHVNPDPKKVPQTLVAYSEVVDLYDKGMKVPDDVTMTWPEDNFGYIRRLPTPAEQQRSGGSGIYYHLQWINGATGA
ncbi:MAG TPA: glycosyl hydrolase 115 family protein, partial [Luteolibacter sp.]|nr:glycosyl hydrolase 115 family protein [Luteolibacter sp.]